MTAAEASLDHPIYKAKYRLENWGGVRGWPEGSWRRHGLVLRGGHRGLDSTLERPTRGQRRDSDLAIETALTLELLFHLSLRQAEGFVGSLLPLLGLELAAPDHTTLSRRARQLSIAQ